MLERGRAPLDQIVVERVLEAVILLAHLAPRDRRRQRRHVQQRREVEPLRLPVRDRALDVEAVGAADHLVHRPEAELRHQLAHFLRDEAEEVLDELGRAGELLAQLRVLRRHAHRAGVQVADAHHHAAHHDQRRRGEAELLRPEQRADDDVPARLHLAVHLHDDAVAQLVEDEHLLRLGEAELPRQTGVLEAGQRRGAGAAVVAGDRARRRNAPSPRRPRRCRRRPRRRASRGCAPADSSSSGRR